MFNTKTIILAKTLRPDLNFASPGAEELIWLKIASQYASGNPVRNATIENGIATFNGVVASSPLVSLKLNIPITQSGSGTPSPTNIRPFVGVSGAVIGQTSDYGEYFRGLLNGTYGFVDLGDLSYTMSASGQLRATRQPNIKSVAGGQTNTIISNSYTRWNGTQPDEFNALDKVFSIGNYNLAVNNIIIRDSDIATASDAPSALSGVYLIYELETFSTPVTPEQFATLCQAFGITGNTYQITFGQTVYSANLDVLRGLLTVSDDYEIRTIDENSNLTVSNGIFALDNFFDIEGDTDSIMCNVYQRGTNQQNTSSVMTNNPDYSFCCRSISTRTRLMIKDTRFETVEDYKTWLENNPVKIYVKKANPQPYTIQLTPTVINTLIGENVIFADVADVTECKYTRK